MTEKNFVNAYVSYDKEKVENIVNQLKAMNVTMKVNTTTDSITKETIYEIFVIEEMINKVHEIIINLQQRD